MAAPEEINADMLAFWNGKDRQCRLAAGRFHQSCDSFSKSIFDGGIIDANFDLGFCLGVFHSERCLSGRGEDEATTRVAR